MELKLGIGLDWINMSYDEWIALAKECEMLGYHYLWIPNEKFFRDMYILAAVVAEHTVNPKIGTFVADPYTYHPALTAAAIATLDEVSSGRAILCIGAGGTGFPAMGIERLKPAKAIKEAVHVIRSLLNGQVVDFQGEVIQSHGAHLNFQVRADIPIIVASRGDLVLQAAGEVADGVMIATYAEPIGIYHALTMIERGARRVNRNLSKLIVISRVDTCISRDRQAAIEALRLMVCIFLWTSYPDRRFVHRVDLEVPVELEKIIAKRDYNLALSYAHLDTRILHR